MADLNLLRTTHPKGPREAFEDMCTLMFCIRLGLAHGVSRRINQKGIESDPVEIGGKVYAYQAKFYDPATALSKKKDELIDAIRAARSEGVTDLMLFINKNRPDRKHRKNGASAEYKYLKEIDETTRGTNGEPEVTLDWWDLSRIQTALDMPTYHYIRDIYLGQPAHAGFYEWECDQFYGNTGSELYGEVPLSECYIEPTVRLEDREAQSAREYIESLVDNAGGTITVIAGEPGHGKTSLCRKATCDFYKNGWLAGKVTNVFHFPLNPAGTDALSNGDLDFYSLLSWGDNRRSEKKKLDADDCKGALVFLDGFDELLGSYPISLEDFIKEHIVDFSTNNNVHVIITTRSAAIDSNKIECDLGSMRVPIARLQPIARDDQLGWIEKYIDILRRTSVEDLGVAPPNESEEVKGLLGYYSDYEQLEQDESLRSILGVPLVFRMVVAARYLPKSGGSISRIYDDLFDATWRRYHLLDMHATSAQEREMNEAKRQLSRHSLRVFAGDDDTAVVAEAIESPWVFSFYTTRDTDEEDESKSRVGFLHRSIYQHFLAREILSWFMRYADKAENAVAGDEFHNCLLHLARRRLDETTLGYIREMHSDINNKEHIGAAFTRAYGILKETDGILPLPRGDADADQIMAITPLERANNVFWNVVSVCSVCGCAVGPDTVNQKTLQLYDLTGCILVKAGLENLHLNQAQFRRANLEGAFLNSTHLQGADLIEANLSRANLRKTDLSRADLSGATLSRACLLDACLSGAYLFEANLSGANLQGADLSGAYLWGADLSGADLSGADLSGADLSGADLSGADLSGAKVREALFASGED